MSDAPIAAVRAGSLLVVDDKEASRNVLARRLASAGFSVATAAGGDEALSLADSIRFDLVLLDVEMPGVSGLDVLRRLRERYSPTDLPVIMITDRTHGADIVEAFRVGANDFLARSIDVPVAIARIRTHLSHKWAIEDLRESEERYALAARGADDGLWDWNLAANLPNRLQFIELLDGAIKRSERDGAEMFGLVLLGLDRFDAVSNSLGPLTADRLLMAVAGRLQSALRERGGAARHEPRATLARFGGDEFSVLLEGITDASDAVRVAQRLQSALGEPFDIDGQPLFTSAAAGITVSATGYVRPADALQDAAIAMHRAKAGAAGACELYDPAMRDRAISRLRVETDLRHAIDREEFDVFYQPIVAIATGRITGFEALARWRHPVRGLVGPTEFIPVAEDTGLIRRLGRLILAEACRRMIDWQQRFGAKAPATMCVNVSGLQLAHLDLGNDLANDIEAVLRETGLESSRLKLEITESAFISDVRAAELTLRRMHAIGVEWSLDDFGTGYSSLSYLHRLRADTVKVDRSFVSGMEVEDRGSEMVRAIVGLAHNLGMDVVAEGVETAEQLSQLRAIGCEYAQGFHFSKPVDVASADVLIATQPWWEALSYTDARVEDQSTVSRGSRRQPPASEDAAGGTRSVPAA